MAIARYLVRDVDDAIAFYITHLGFELVEQYGPAMAIVRRDDLTLWLAGPTSSAAQPAEDGTRPAPGGWNRIVLQVADLDSEAARLQVAGCKFAIPARHGPGGAQLLLEDPSGNKVEIFQAR